MNTYLTKGRHYMKHRSLHGFTKRIIAASAAAITAVSALCLNSFAEDERKGGIKGIQEIGGAFDGGNSFPPDADTDFDPDSYTLYYTEIGMIRENAEAEVAECVIDESFTDESVNRSCTIKALDHDLTIDAGDNDIIVLLDDLTLGNTITVSAGKGTVRFFIRGTFTCGGNSSGILYDGMDDGVILSYDDSFPICFYSEKEALMVLKDNCTICGILRTPEMFLDATSSGAFYIEYISEYCKDFSGIRKLKAGILGNVLVSGIINKKSSDVLLCNTASHGYGLRNDIVRYGDANCDGILDLSDAISIMQALANPDKYSLTSKGRDNADTNGDGVTANDALVIQQHLLGLDK